MGEEKIIDDGDSDQTDQTKAANNVTTYKESTHLILIQYPNSQGNDILCILFLMEHFEFYIAISNHKRQ